MEIWKSMIGRHTTDRRSRRARARRPQVPALVESLEDRVLLAATLYQTPIDVIVSTETARPQDISSVGVAANGDFVVVWEEVISVSETNIAFRRFNADGTPKDATQRYAANSAVDERRPDIAMAGPGGFVLVWQQINPADNTYDIFFARYNFSGALAVGPTRANATTAGHQVDPTVAFANNGDFVIGWTTNNTATTGDIVFRRFSVDGTPIDAGDVTVTAESAVREFRPEVAINRTTGEFVLVWTEQVNPGNQTDEDRDVFYRLYNADGTPATAKAQVNVTDLGALDFQDRPDVAMADTGEFVVVWEDVELDTRRNDVRFRMFNANGTAKTATDQTVIATPGLEEGDPVVAINTDGSRFVVAYETGEVDPTTGRTDSIFFQVFDGTGTRVAGPSQIRANAKIDDVGVSMNGLGDFVISSTLIGDNITVADQIGATAVPLLKASEIVAGAGPGGGPALRVFDAMTGQMTRFFFPFHRSVSGGVTVATADFTGDTFPDFVAGIASDNFPAVRVFDGSSGRLLTRFHAFPSGFRGGVTVATGDVNGDGTPEIIVGARAGGGPAVRVFNGLTGEQIGNQILAFDVGFRGGVNVATGDINGDGTDEIIVGAGPGGLPLVRIFNGATGAQIGGDILAFGAGFQGGVFVSAGDFDGNGTSEIVAGAGPGGGPAVRVFNPSTGEQIGETIFAFPIGFRGGVTVGTGDVNSDTVTEIIVGAGPGGGPAVRAFNASTGAQVGEQLFVFGRGFRGGVFVAGRALGTPGEGSPLRLDDSNPPAPGPVADLTEDDLAPIVSAAQTRLQQAGLSEDLLARLASVQFVVADLGGNLLGVARSGLIYLDDDAAGFGWFVDYSPLLDEEFSGDGSQLVALDGPASGRVDLLTAVLHEMGHALGLHHDDGLMAETLAAGVRRLPSADELDALFASDDLLEAVV